MQDSGAVMERDESADLAEGELLSLQMLSVLSSRSPSLHHCAYSLLGNQADAEDAVQEALLAAYKHLHQFRGEAQLSTWLTAIVMNCARMQLRKRPRQIHIPLDTRIGEEQEYSVSDTLTDNRPSPEDEYLQAWLNAQLTNSAARLSPTLQRTFRLRFVDHLSLRETARVLGIPIGTVKAQIARARAKLMRSIQGVIRPNRPTRTLCGRRRKDRSNPVDNQSGRRSAKSR